VDGMERKAISSAPGIKRCSICAFGKGMMSVITRPNAYTEERVGMLVEVMCSQPLQDVSGRRRRHFGFVQI